MPADRTSLALFEAHGARVVRVTGDQAECICPWCGKKKMYIHRARLVWDCKVCNVHGNAPQFLERVARENAKRGPLAPLAKDRGGLKLDTLKAFGVGMRAGAYTYPALLPRAIGTWAVSDVRRYSLGGKPRSTPGAHLGLIMSGDTYVSGATADSRPVWVCEGEWDAMALWQTLRAAGNTDAVVGVCGAATFPHKAIPWFSRRDVFLLYDNDEPGQRGCVRTWSLLSQVGAKLKRVIWPQDESLPVGYDVRDLCMALSWRHKPILEKLRMMLSADAPAGSFQSSVQARIADEIDAKGKGLAHRDVRKQYQRWLELKNTEILDVIFGTIFANRIGADPLWLFIVGPPGSGKSEPLMSLDGAPLIHCTTSLSPHSLISGMSTAGGDPSLIPRIIGKTLVVKDFTTLLSLAQQVRDEIFGILRDAYDGRTEKTFGNNVTRRYEGHFGILGGVTGIIDGVAAQNSVLGERFIKYRLRSMSHEETTSVVLRALQNLSHETEMRQELRATAKTALNRPVLPANIPECPTWFAHRCADIAGLLSRLRGCVGRERYTGQVLFKPSAEMPTRLAKQFLSLAKGIGIFRNVAELDEEIYSIIGKVAMDSAPDRVEEVVKQLYIHDHVGLVPDIALWTRLPSDTCRYILEDLRLLRIVTGGERGKLWELTGEIIAQMDRLKLYAKEKAWRTESSSESTARKVASSAKPQRRKWKS